MTCIGSINPVFMKHRIFVVEHPAVLCYHTFHFYNRRWTAEWKMDIYM